MRSLFSAAPLATCLGLCSLAQAQFEGWESDQVNASMCLWDQHRALVVRDSVYIDGGKMYWIPGMKDGSYGAASTADNPLGLMFSLNFSNSFNLAQNLSYLLKPISKAPGGEGLANNLAPNYNDGGMLGNDGQFFMYGGLVRNTEKFPEPHLDDVLGYQAFRYGPERPFTPGFVSERLPKDMSRYIAFGAQVSVPSENKAFYFSGLRSPTYGFIQDNLTKNLSVNAVNVSDTMISLTFDSKEQDKETWDNMTLPENIKGRASAEAVFLPVGSKGVIAIIGGVTYPEFAALAHKSDNAAASKSESEEFMKVIDIYDIGENKWYKQITDSPETMPARTRGCAVMIPANDRSSFNIYYYGGYTGQAATEDLSDDVWVLSIPSFKWIKAKNGDPAHARRGHRCVTPYPDQMMIIGGSTKRSLSAQNLDCLKGGVIQLLNLTSLEWMGSYDPAVYGSYGVPKVVQSAIGGDYAGGATLTTPAASGWQDPSLSKVFATAYPTSKITTWYPYGSATPTNRPNIGDNGGGPLPKWVPPVLGVVLGLVLVTALIIAWLLWRRRNILKKGATHANSDDNGLRILSWIRGQPSETKAMTVTTEDAPANQSEMTESRTMSVPVIAPVMHHEMDNTELAELMGDTSPRVELHDTALSHVDILDKHTHFAQGTSPSASRFAYASLPASDHTSTVSRASALAGQSTISGDDPADTPDTPNLARSSRVTSGVSGISERDVHHLRQISEASVSETASDHARIDNFTHRSAPEVSSSAFNTPSPVVSPPTGPERNGSDYLSAKPLPTSPGGVSPS